jgi:tetratricopeptide (TPR) repeat protein
MNRKSILAVALVAAAFSLPLAAHADDKAVDQALAKARSVGDNRKAVQILTQAIAESPDAAELYLTRSHYNDLAAKPKDALEDANKYVQMKPGDYEGYTNRAKVLAADEKFDAALTDANKAVELSPQEPDVYFARSDIYREMNKKAEAAADEKKANDLLKKLTGK